MFYCNRQCNRQEVITVSDDLVSIEQGVRQPNQAITYQRLWAKYLVSPPPHPWGVSRIAIRSHNHESEFGQFLSQADKQQLVKGAKARDASIGARSSLHGINRFLGSTPLGQRMQLTGARLQ